MESLRHKVNIMLGLPLIQRLTLRAAKKRINRQTLGLYQAPYKILEVVSSSKKEFRRKNSEELAKLLLNETTTLGVRFTRYERLILERTAGKVKTSYGNIRVKIARGPGDLKRITPEYDDCVEVARSKNIPFIKVYSKILTELESIYGDKA